VRNISVALTTRQIRNQTKSVTRRCGWTFVQVGDLLQPIVKGQGLKHGETVEPVGAPIRVISVRREPLSRLRDEAGYGIDECRREGFGDHPDLMWPSSFVEYFAQTHNCDVDDEITRIAFEYTVPLTAAQMAFMQQHGPHLHRRAGEEFERERSDDPRLDWLKCNGCGEMTLVQAEQWYDRELSTGDATAALSHAFQQQIGRVSR
jgi:hypothetical protein